MFSTADLCLIVQTKTYHMRLILVTVGLLFLHSTVQSQTAATDSAEDERNDNTTVPAEVYDIDGEKVTFSRSLGSSEKELLGSWSCAGKSTVERLDFNDTETVIVTVGDNQLKGTWFLQEERIVLNVTGLVEAGLKSNEIKLNRKTSELGAEVLIFDGAVFKKLK